MLKTPMTDLNGTFIVWLIYQRPLDFPKWWVLRRQFVRAGEISQDPIACVGASVDQLRHGLPRGLYCMPHQPGEDRAIFESWF